MTPTLRLTGLALSFALAACSRSESVDPGGARGDLVEFSIEAPALTESSGLARSQREAVQSPPRVAAE